jgi:hypothetical protein
MIDELPERLVSSSSSPVAGWSYCLLTATHFIYFVRLKESGGMNPGPI